MWQVVFILILIAYFAMGVLIGGQWATNEKTKQVNIVIKLDGKQIAKTIIPYLMNDVRAK